MVASATAVKSRLENKIFKKPPASDVTIIPRTKSKGALGGYYGTTQSDGSPVTVLGVPYSTLRNDRVYYKFGTDAEGETKIAVKADTVVSRDDKVYLPVTGKTYEVTSIEDYPYHDVNLAIIMTVKELIGQFTYVDLLDSDGEYLLDSLGEQLQVLS